MKLIRNNIGSFVLPLLISTSAGVLFVFLYFNLAQYVNASSALERAAATAARCVTSMDADCTNYGHNGAPVPASIRWYGFRGTSGGVDLAVPMVDYNAQMYTQRFGANYAAFSSHAVNRVANYDTYRANEYQARIQQRAFLEAYGTLTGHTQVQYYTPKSQGYPALEKDDSKSAADWVNAQAAQGYQFVEAPLATPSFLTIPENAVAEVRSSWITVPALQSSLGCQSANGTPCTVSNNAGADIVAADDWKNKAFISIKAFAQAQSNSDHFDAKLRWSPSENVAGLRLLVNDSEGSRSYCLGGRIDSGVPNRPDWRWVDLYLRGPKDASGGDNPDDILDECAKERPGYSYENLYVRRGGQFQIVAYLKATENPVNVYPHFFYYFDDYALTATSADMACEDVRYSFSRNWPMCETINPAQCKVANPFDPKGNAPNYFQWVGFTSDCIFDQSDYPNMRPGHEVALQVTEWNNVCTNDGNNTTVASCPNPEKVSPKVAICSGKSDAIKNLVQPDAGCGTCTTTVEQTGYAEVADKGSCQTAVPVQRDFPCPNDFRYLAADGNPRDTCQELAAQVTGIESATRNYNDAARKVGLPEFGTTVKTSWISPQPANGPEEFTWTEVGPAGKPVLYAGALTRKTYTLPENLLLTRYRRTSSPEYKIEAKDFLTTIFSDPQHSQTSVAWDDYQRRVNEFVSVTHADNVQAVAITGEPFDEPVPQLYWGQQLGSGYEFARISCGSEATCPNSYVPFSSEEAMLRSFASQTIAEANDPQYVFTYLKEPYANPLGTFTSVSDANNFIDTLGYPQCTPYRAICHDSHVISSDAELVAQGPIEQYSALPLSCADGTYVNCFNKIDLVDNSTPPTPITPDVSYAMAKQAALSEVSPILPQLGGNLCSGDSRDHCVAVDVDSSVDSGNQAAVTVSVELPISFPLSTMLGRDTLHLSYTKTGVFEVAMVGREN